MPEVNGVWLNPVPQGKELVAIQKKANRCYFANRVVSYSHYGICILMAIGSIASWAYGSYNILYNPDYSIRLRDSHSYLGKALVPVLGGDLALASDVGYQALEYALIGITSLAVFVLTTTYFVERLEKHYLDQYYDCRNIIEASKKSQVPDYDDMQSYDQVVDIDKTSVGPISYAPVEEIEQKVFYRGEVYEYYYLLTAYRNNPNSRDHTGQLYDISKFYRIDNNNIKYID